MSHQKKRRLQKGKSSQAKSAPFWLMFLVGAAALAVLYGPDLFHSKSPLPAAESAPQTSPGTTLPSKLARATSDDSGQEQPVFPTNFNTLSASEKSAFYQNLGSQLLEKRRFAEAIAQYRMAVKLNPEDEDTHYNLGLALAKGGDPESAKKEYPRSAADLPRLRRGP